MKGSIMNLQSKKKILEKKISILKKMCHEIDPYRPLDPQTIEQLQSFDLHRIIDPFVLTNKLLLKLEDSILEYKNFQKTL